ncbi:MAG TPA: serine/threonine-protein kinase [Candidatus Acidoferrales bacterium]|nr:serine/threonine-protein kinase [Candidatus Acidoferrales bacterium]
MAERKFPLTDVIVGAILSVVLLLGFFVGFGPLDSLELKLYDLRAKMRATHKVGDEIVIVAVDDPSVQQLGRFPWPRSYTAELVDVLSEDEAKVIALDLLYSDAEVNQGLEAVRDLRKQISDSRSKLVFQQGEGVDVRRERAVADQLFAQLDKVFADKEKQLDDDGRLADSIALAGNVVLADNFGLPGPPLGRPDQAPPADILKNALPGASASLLKGTELDAPSIVPPIERFAKEAKAIGEINWLPDRDGTIRTSPLLVEYMDKVYPSFALQTARTYLNLEPGEVTPIGQAVRIGNRTIPTNPLFETRVNFYGEARTFPQFSFVDVVTKKVSKENFKGKIVLVGLTSTGLGEQRATPISATLPAVEYFANVIENFLQGNVIVRPTWARTFELGALILFALFITFGVPLLPAGVSAGIAGVLLIAYDGAAVWLFSSKGYWITMLYPSLLLVLGYVVMVSKRYFGTEREKGTLETESAETLKMLGLSFQGQGMLDMAWEKFRRVPVDAGMKDTLYALALDFERKRQFNKAVAVLEHIGAVDKKFKDIAERAAKLKAMGETQILGTAGLRRGGADSTVMVTGTDVKPTLGRYEVLKELGKGAMGTVFLGRDPKINRQVAIKTLRFDDPDLTDEDKTALRERFFREAESAGRLNHPHIVNIYDAGEDQDIHYIAMELLDGADLKPWGAKGSLHPMSEVVNVVADVADALDYAHSNNVVHRDIKPANLMLLKSGKIKVTDFGIARITDQSKTATGTVLGTPSYMSPEQLAGKKVDGRSDIFSLGVCLYELLTGEKPFTGDSVATLVTSIVNTPHRPIQQLDAKIPEGVARVIDRALQKDPENRYQRAKDMAADLRKALTEIAGARP